MATHSRTIAARRLIPALILAGTACAAWPAEADITRCVVSVDAAKFGIECPNSTLERLAAALRQTGRVTVTYPDELGGTPLSVAPARGPLKDILASALSAFDYAFVADVPGQTTPVSKVLIIGISATAPRVAAAQPIQPAWPVRARQPPSGAAPMPIQPATAADAAPVPSPPNATVAAVPLPPKDSAETAEGDTPRPLPAGVSTDQNAGPIPRPSVDAAMPMPAPPSADSLPQMPIRRQDQTGGPIPLGNAGIPMPAMRPPGSSR